MPFQWEEFEKRKEKFLADPRNSLELISFYIHAHALQKAVRNQAKFKSSVRKFRKQLDAFALLVSTPRSAFHPRQLEGQIGALKDSVECMLLDPDEPEASDSCFPVRTGPREYPELFRIWIFDLIESAKNDRNKLIALVKFFSPSGEFDLWIRKKSKGVFKGPRKKTDSCTVDSVDEDIKWLNEVKRRCRSIKRRTSKMRSPIRKG